MDEDETVDSPEISELPSADEAAQEVIESAEAIREDESAPEPVRDLAAEVTELAAALNVHISEGHAYAPTEHAHEHEHEMPKSVAILVEATEELDREERSPERKRPWLKRHWGELRS